MQSKGNAPNAEQKRWREMVRECGSIVSYQTPVEIHHVVGATARHNKVPVGHWWILPLTHDEHQLLTRSPSEFAKQVFMFNMVGRFDAEKMLFLDLIRGFPNVVPNEVVDAIIDYHR